MRLVGMFPVALVATACVVGTDRPASRVDVARGPEGDGTTPATAGSSARCKPDSKSRPPPPNPDAVWVDGFCHFDGVRYVSVKGRWETLRKR